VAQRAIGALTIMERGNIMNYRLIATASLILAASGLGSAAQAADANAPCPSGSPAIVRLSKIIPGGTMDGFKKAVADHSKWYADHGYPEDRQVLAPVLVYDQAKSVWGIATDQVMTIHTHATSVPMAKHDAAWDAYVAEYKANSDIVSSTAVCMP
jgi:hypothetical protein